VVDEKGGVDVLAENGGGIVVRALAAFLQDDQALGPHVLFGEHQIGHAVGFHGHDQFQAVQRHGLKITSVVGRGEGVLAPAIARHTARKLARRQRLGALEHQVFKEMRNTRLAGRIVGRAHLVPHHVVNHRNPVVGNDHHLHAVGQGEGLRIEDAGPRPRPRPGQRKHQGGQHHGARKYGA
jgi:hypothetical protein